MLFERIIIIAAAKARARTEAAKARLSYAEEEINLKLEKTSPSCNISPSYLQPETKPCLKDQISTGSELPQLIPQQPHIYEDGYMCHSRQVKFKRIDSFPKITNRDYPKLTKLSDLTWSLFPRHSKVCQPNSTEASISSAGKVGISWCILQATKVCSLSFLCLLCLLARRLGLGMIRASTSSLTQTWLLGQRGQFGSQTNVGKSLYTKQRCFPEPPLTLVSPQ